MDLSADIYPSTVALRRIKWIGQAGRAIALAGILFIIAVSIWTWSDAGFIERAARAHLGVVEQSALANTVKLLAISFSLIPVVLLVYGLSTVARLFNAFSSGRVFATQNVSCVGQLGWTFVIAGLAESPLRVIVGLLAGFPNMPGFRSLVIPFGLETVTILVVGIGLLAITTVIREAVRLHGDHQQFV